MCWLLCCTSTVFFVFCMSGLYAIEKDTVKIPHFDCDFAYLFFSFCQVYFKAMSCYLSWILMSISLLRVHLIIILKIPSLIQLVFSSVQFNCSVVSDSLWPHGLQHARPPCPLLTPRVYPNSCPLSQWCHPAISSSDIPFSFCPQSFSASGSFEMSQLFTSGGQNIGVSASTSVLPVNTQDWFPLGWTGWISLQSKGLSRVFSNTTVQKHQFSIVQLSLQSNSHIHTWLLEKP